MKLHELLCATAVVAVCASPAYAGEEVIYEAAPAWVEPVDFDAALAKDEMLVLFDRQVRMEDGVVHDYLDIAYKIETPQALTQLGTVQVPWLPDKGDLFVHNLEIVRDGEVIDLLANGGDFDVLRREQQLESRSLDGMLTATMAIPGLRVGDVLRMRRSTTTRDQALNGEMQVLQGVFAEPAELGFGRMVVTWPEGTAMRYQVTRDVALAEPETVDGYRRLAIEFPVDELDEMPGDAPARYQQASLLQVGTYRSWEEVSAKMAPHFSTEGSITPGGDVAREVASIEAQTDVPLERAALALQVVQDRIAYLLNGLDGGNYLPQQPEQTWELRYGDCKAKSMLLLAMLREMGIKSEAVLVRSQAGDWVREMLPMPGDFDHMIVHATIDGEDYWLDGTNAGIRLSTIGEVPRFFYALPLREGGAELVRMDQRWQDTPDRATRVSIDQSAGFDYPALFDIDVKVQGAMAARFQNIDDTTEEDEITAFASQYASDIVGDNIVFQADIEYDEDTGIARVIAKGLTSTWWDIDRNSATLTPYTSSNGMTFSPDRARREWRDIPYQVGGPLRLTEQVEIRLPEGNADYVLRGTDADAQMVGGSRITRTATLDGNMLRVRSDKAEIPVEIPADEFAVNRRAANKLKSGDYKVRANEGVTRYWEYSPEEVAKRMEGIEDALDQYVALDPDDADRLSLRAGMIGTYTYDYEAAARDLTRAIDEKPSAELYAVRAQTYANAGEWERALDDALYAYDLQGDFAMAAQLADIQAKNGDVEGALALLEEFDLGGDDRVAQAQLRAELEGSAGRADDGFAMIEQILTERPGDAQLLNAKCWHMGTWRYKLDEAEAVCSEAVQTSSYDASVLDSRAMAYYRLGEFDKALKDIDAALSKEPNMAASRYLKGVILSEQGRKKEGREEIAYAKRLAPQVVRQYALYGIEQPE
ncbi:DUF3857 domain-containing protein [Pseudoblastomonas halimionae]|uniref:DUF3857 domain-containing protein n=1 Tax=Alteriqipengyuania halimionae TaxID=1926630 RepID=UPI00136FBC55|nr:DUF3857 domain-containing protein [Alteriqipengyuania halimionae]